MSKRKQTILDFWGRNKRTNPGNSGSDEPVPSTSSSSDEPVPSSSSSFETTQTKMTENQKESRTFQSSWLEKFSWLSHDRTKNKMFCELCKKHKKLNSLTEGSDNFRTSTLTRHSESKDHTTAVMAEQLRPNFETAVKRAVSEKEDALINSFKSVYWLAKENLPMHKYPSLLQLLSSVDCKNTVTVSHAKNATYSSETAANDMLHSLACVIKSEINEKLQKSPFISVFADESTDIGCQKKLVIFSRMLDPNTFLPSTHFLENIKISDGTGRTVSQSIIKCLTERNIPSSTVMGFGSDGAKSMTGTKEGATGYLLRENPMLLNFHCIAHRLALVSSQAASSVSYLKEYQETLTGLFYFFKASANRCEKLTEIQSLLDEPNLRMTEVHDVRWMSIYKAVETVYRCLDSLITVFSTDKDPKAKGFAKKIGNADFISTTYMLMDILAIITELCLVFQKTDLDVSMVEVSVEGCRKSLEDLKNMESSNTKPSCYLDQLQDHLKQDKGKLVFKGNHIVSKGHRNVKTLRDNFIESLIQKLDERFPAKDSNLMYSFGVLGMRPISFLSMDDLRTWGDDKIENLIGHFGHEQEHNYLETTSKAQPLIDPEETRKEWSKLKPLVINSGYPRDNLSVLWGLINQYHKDDFPNLLKLSALALTAPIHTADCERGFSCQNITKTALRNRLSPDRLDDLVTIATEGVPLEEFDFHKALDHWKERKNRRLLMT